MCMRDGCCDIACLCGELVSGCEYKDLPGDMQAAPGEERQEKGESFSGSGFGVYCQGFPRVNPWHDGALYAGRGVQTQALERAAHAGREPQARPAHFQRVSAMRETLERNSRV